MTYEDILYDRDESGIVTITINRPEKLNAFRPETAEELSDAFRKAWADRGCGVVILTGAGDRAFCVGGDQSARGEGGGYGDTARSDVGIDIEDVHTIIRDIPKPVIAAVNGYAIGGGHVVHVLCDLTIAADHARFGQVGPKVGSVDPGFGTAYLARARRAEEGPGDLVPLPAVLGRGSAADGAGQRRRPQGAADGRGPGLGQPRSSRRARPPSSWPRPASTPTPRTSGASPPSA